jgi:uncharacterized membrane protein (UPF0127 family)
MQIYIGKTLRRVVALEKISELCQGVMLEAKHGQMPKETLYLFPSTGGDVYHMRGVPFDVDIAFTDKDHKLLKVSKMQSEDGKAKAPEGTRWAIEGEAGFFDSVKVGEEFIP